MTRFQTLAITVFSILIWNLKPTGAYPWSGLGLGGSRALLDNHCIEHQEYLHGNLCCLLCPAGTRFLSACTRSGQKGKCEECSDGTYTQFANSVPRCFKCTPCRPDQEIVRPCTHTQDAEYQCRPGGFCTPDEACEVCKKCKRCKNDEEIVRNCTATANTECKKVPPVAGSASAVSVIVAVVLIALGIIIVITVVVCFRAGWWRKLCNKLNARQRSDRCPTDERSSGEPRRPISNLILPRQLEDQHFPKLVPVNGDESLGKCFEYFEDIDFNYHTRFFRSIGITDNVIKSKEHLLYEDKIHELLNIWVEREGRDATLNDLLKALLDLNQRRTAETVKEKAIHNGHYFSEDE